MSFRLTVRCRCTFYVLLPYNHLLPLFVPRKQIANTLCACTLYILFYTVGYIAYIQYIIYFDVCLWRYCKVCVGIVAALFDPVYWLCAPIIPRYWLSAAMRQLLSL